MDISLTEEDYRAIEPGLFMPVMVTKSTTIASDITLTVTPLTIAEAEAQGIQPPNVPPEFLYMADVIVGSSRAQSKIIVVEMFVCI